VCLNEAGPETRGAKSRSVSRGGWWSWIDRARTGTEKSDGPAAAVPMSRVMWAAGGVRDPSKWAAVVVHWAQGTATWAASKGQPKCCLTWQELLSCEHLAIPAAGIQHLLVLGMTMISANTLAFGLTGKERFVLREYEFGIWKRGRAIGIWGILYMFRILVTMCSQSSLSCLMYSIYCSLSCVTSAHCINIQ
jgi:hypothetical protein